MGDVQLVNSWSHSLQYPKGSYIPVLELPWKFPPKVPSAKQNLLAHGILYIPVVPVFMAFPSLLRVKQALVHQLLDL